MGEEEKNVKTYEQLTTVCMNGTDHNQPVLITCSAASTKKKTGEVEMVAVSKKTEKLIEESNEWGVLRLLQLDSLLLDDRRFDATVELLNRRLNSFVEITDTAAEKEDANPIDTMPGRRRQPVRNFRLGLDALQQPMSRADEYRWAKRLEFHRRRLYFFLGSLDLAYSAPVQKGDWNELSAHPPLSWIEDVLRTNPRVTRIEKRTARSLWKYYNDCRAGWVEKNLQKVTLMVRKYQSYGVSSADLYQEGYAALIRAVEKYDWRKKVRFWTYAVFWVRQAVERYICSNRGMIRIPHYIQQKIRRLRREGPIRTDLDDDIAREMTTQFGMKQFVAGNIVDLYRGQISLDGMDPNTKDFLVSWNLRKREQDDVDRVDEHRLIRHRLKRAVRRLPERERLVLTQRYGLDKKKTWTLEGIGASLNLSRERIRQIEKKALSRLALNGNLKTD